MERYDCVIVGAGWYGLGVAKQYLDINPNDSIVIFDSASSVGGTWAEHRIYSGIKTNNQLGTYEYPDFPMDYATYGVKTGEHIPGAVVHRYLKDYADKFDIARRVQFNTAVTCVEHLDGGGWNITLMKAGEQNEGKAYARRLVLATGLTSHPFLPHFKGQENFGRRIVHSRDLPKNFDTLENCKSVTIFGGGKCSWDAVYTYASAGVKVDWVIRSSGRGACWMTKAHVGPWNWWVEEVAYTRMFTWFNPCIWGDAGGYSSVQKLLHKTAPGRALVDLYWKTFSKLAIEPQLDFDSHPNTAKLRPRVPVMFTGPTFSILNYDTDVLDLIRSDLVTVHDSDIDHLSEGKVHLSNGTVFSSDALISNTGWKNKSPLKFLPAGIEKEIGLPHAVEEGAPEKDLANQATLLSEADKDIFQRLPRLKKPLVWNKNYTSLGETESKSKDDDDDNENGIETKASKPSAQTPYMLYHFIIPPSSRFLRHRDLAFAGLVSNFSNPAAAHIQGLWITAYFAGKLANKDLCAAATATLDDDKAAIDRLRFETILHNRFGKWRYPTDWGDNNPALFMDGLAYFDMLLGDIGIKNHRKKSRWAEITSPYGPRDYACINEEWKQKLGKKS